MPLQFEVTVPYGDTTLTVRADSFADLHEAAARLYELERDAMFLRDKGVERAVPAFRTDSEGNAYYGFTEVTPKGVAPRNVTFGQNREKGAVPFFPKGADGYWEHDASKDGHARGERPSNGASQSAPGTVTLPPAPGTVTLPPAQAAAARAIKEAGLDKQAAIELLGRYGVERISDLSDADAEDIAKSDLALPF